jgi:hypothetical protein
MASSTEWMATGLSINGFSYCYVRIVPLIKYTFVNANPQIMCGSLDHIAERVLPGIQLHGWRILMAPHPGEIDKLLVWQGYSEASDVFTPTDTLPEYNVAVRLKADAVNVWTTTACKVDKAIWRAQMGMNPLMLQLDVIGKTSVPDGEAWSPTSITTDSPYEFTSSNGAFSIDGTVRAIRSWVFAQHNHLQTRFNNSVTADVVANTMRTIHTACDTPWSDDEQDLLTTATGSGREDGVPISCTFTHGNQSLQFATPLNVWEAKPPSVLSKSADLRLDQYYLAIKGADPVATITHDPTA